MSELRPVSINFLTNHFSNLFLMDEVHDARQKMLAYSKNKDVQWPEMFTAPGNLFRMRCKGTV